MSFLNQRSASSMVGVVLLGVAINYGVRIAYAGGVEEYFDPSEQIENQLEDALSQNPGHLAVMTAMEAEFPEDYNDFLETMTRRIEAGDDQAAVMTAGGREISAFLAGHRHDFAAAPSGNLAAVRKAEHALLVGLRSESAVACGDYIFGTIQVADPLSAKTNKLLGSAVAAKVRAMAAGRRNQQLRFDVTPKEVEELAAAMQAKSASRAQIDALVHGGDFAQLTDEQQCDAAAKLMAAMDSLPAESADLLTGAFLAPR